MSYGKVLAPTGGYSDYANPSTTYLGHDRNREGATDKGVSDTGDIGHKEGTFRELRVTDGVGDYHVNHFIGFGASVKPANSADFVAQFQKSFFSRFVHLFNLVNVARVRNGQYLAKGGHATFEFEVGGNVGGILEAIGGAFHSDWVSVQESADGTSFYNSTLMRAWLLKEEKAAIYLNKDLEWPIEVNRHHFLAGRRSFKIGYSSTLRRLYVETAALERSSLCEYYMVEKTGAFREAIVQIWCNLLENVMKHIGGKWVSTKELPKETGTGYKVKGNVFYRSSQHKSPSALLSAEWFAKVVARHPGLLAGLPL